MLECADCARCLSQDERMLGIADWAAACRRAAPRSVTVLLWISGRADRAQREPLACVPQSDGRIGELPLLATHRDYTQPAQADIAPTSGGRTTRVLCVVVVARLARRTSGS